MAEMNIGRDILGPMLKGQQIAAQRRSARVKEIELEAKMANWESLAKHREAEAIKWNQKKREDAGLDAAVKLSVFDNEETGLPDIDSAKGMQHLIENGQGHMVDEFMEKVAGIREDMAKAVAAESKQDALYVANAARGYRNEEYAVGELNKVEWIGGNVVGYQRKSVGDGGVHIISKAEGPPMIFTDDEFDKIMLGREQMMEEFQKKTALALKNDELTTAQKEYEQIKDTWKGGGFEDWLLLRDEYKAGRQLDITRFGFNKADIEKDREIVRTARASSQTLGIMEKLLPSTPVGKGQKLKFGMRKAAAALGELIPAFRMSDAQLNNMQNQELFDLLSKNLAYSQRALYMPGQLSNQEGQILQSMVANIGNQRASAMLLIQLQLGFNKQIISVDNAARALLLKDVNMEGWYGDRGIRDKMWADFKKEQQTLVVDYVKKNPSALNTIAVESSPGVNPEKTHVILQDGSRIRLDDPRLQ